MPVKLPVIPCPSFLQSRRLTLFGRAVALITGEFVANGVIWAASGIFLSQADGVIGLALLAWTIGLRHGLDADHISAIDNATRQLVSLGQLPITCGLWFSLGHSTIVIAVNVAIAISVDIYGKLDKVGSVGGIVGASVSASFLFLIACANTFYLIQAIKERKRVQKALASGEPLAPEDPGKIHGGGCLVRIVGPLLRSVDRPWKMYPVGILFGFGFDTASSIALLAISAVAQRGADGKSMSHGKIVFLPFLFTAGMTLVDSLDSVLMLYAYAGPTQDPSIKKFALTYEDKLVLEESEEFAPVSSNNVEVPLVASSPIVPVEEEEDIDSPSKTTILPQDVPNEPTDAEAGPSRLQSREERILASKANTISSLSITLTLLSILVALSISLIEIMGLIGDNCSKCTEAAEDPNGGGLAGSWWRAWARANDQSGYIGAAIVGVFAAILIGFHVGKWAMKRWRAKRRVTLQE